jgi:hypothetical protein
VVAVAPGLSLQPGSQRCHWYENESGPEPAHIPGDAVNGCPTVGFPEIVAGEPTRGGIGTGGGGGAYVDGPLQP